MQDYEHAIVDYGQAIDLNPQNASTYGNRGNAYYALQDYQRAIADYDRAIDLDPQDTYVYYNRGAVYKQLNQLNLARADFERFLELSNKPQWRSMAEAALRELDATPTPGGDTP